MTYWFWLSGSNPPSPTKTLIEIGSSPVLANREAMGRGRYLGGSTIYWFRGRNWLALLTVNQGVASSSLAGTAKCIAEFLKKVHAWVGKGADHSAVGSSPTYASRLDVI